MQNKKTIMFFSAILITIFHLWINITNINLEIYLKQLCVIGVDLFFFVSVYNLQKKERINFIDFLKNRFNTIYFKFIVLSVVMFFISSWSITKLLKVIFGIDLILKGGGSFLWFLPAIMIMYILLPIFIRLDRKYKLTKIFVIIIYLISVILINNNDNLNQLLIINRIPIILISYYLAKTNLLEKLKENKIKYNLTATLIIIVGIIISYIVFIKRINIITDIIYITNIPIEIGILMLLDNIEANKTIEYLSKFTLEMYALQMMIGFKLVGLIYKIIKIKLLTNITSIMIIILLSIILGNIFMIKDKIIKGSK